MRHIRLGINPVPASRPRVTGRGFSYYAEPYRSFRDEVKEIIQEAWASGPLSGDLIVEIHVYVAPPRKSKLARPRPDVDNFAKAVLDGMNGIVFHDDTQVGVLRVEKHWDAPGASGHINVTVVPVTTDDGS